MKSVKNFKLLLIAVVLCISSCETYKGEYDSWLKLKQDIEYMTTYSHHTFASTQEMMDLMLRYNNLVNETEKNDLSVEFLNDKIGYWIKHVVEKNIQYMNIECLSSGLERVNAIEHRLLNSAPDVAAEIIFKFFHEEKAYYDELLETKMQEEKRQQELETEKRKEEEIKKQENIKNQQIEYQEVIDFWKKLLIGDLTFFATYDNSVINAIGNKKDDDTIILERNDIDSNWGVISISGNGKYKESLEISVMFITSPEKYRFFKSEGVSKSLKMLLNLKGLDYTLVNTYFVVSEENFRKYRNGGYKSWNLEDAVELYLIVNN